MMEYLEFSPSQWAAKPLADAPSKHAVSTCEEDSTCSVERVEEVVCRVEAACVDIAPSYAEWRDLGFALSEAMGEGGLSYYHRLSRFHGGYNPAECDKQYRACLASKGHGITLSSLFYLVKQAGVSILGLTRDGVVANDVKGSCASSLVATSSSLETEDEGHPSLTLPAFSPLVRDRLPTLLRRVVALSESDEDADLLLLGTLTTLSACLPNVYGMYGGRHVFSNLFLFVSAHAASGKGRLSLCRHLVAPVHRMLRKKYQHEVEVYKMMQAEYVVNKKKNSGEMPPVEPPLRMLFIPANSSATSLYQSLNDNQGVGLIFETEGDTLATIFRTDYGNFSDGFRKAFHHETISYQRRKNRELVELETPRLSTVLSGTPRQISTLIPDAENGLFSRFIFYSMPMNIAWHDMFTYTDDKTLDEQFAELGENFFELYKSLAEGEKLCFALTKAQQNEFNRYFAEVQTQYALLLGKDMVASIRRLGLIVFRMAMILTVLRIMESGEWCTTLICRDDDFDTALTLARHLLLHTAQVYRDLHPNEQEESPSQCNLLQAFYKKLPEQFTRVQAKVTISSVGLSEKSLHRYIKRLCDYGLVCRLQHGVYKKCAPKHVEKGV